MCKLGALDQLGLEYFYVVFFNISIYENETGGIKRISSSINVIDGHVIPSVAYAADYVLGYCES